MSNKNNGFISYGLTFVLGVLTGTILGLLFAPMTGQKMQKKVVNAKDRMFTAVEDSVENVQSVLRKVAR